MKKILLLATLVLGVVSCMKDQPVEAGLTGDGNIVLSVGLPADATRAAGTDSALGAIDNGLDLTEKYDIRYILEVFDANETLAKRIVKFEDTATETTFELRLIPGRHYSFVVWADFVQRNANGEVTVARYDVTSLREVYPIGAHKAMDESRDAYTAVFNTDKDDEGEVFSSASTISMTLTRPFAKLRVVTNDIDEIYSDLQSAKIEYTVATYQQFDALTKVASEPSLVTKSVNYTKEAYKYAGEPTTEGEQTLFADYLLGTETGTVQFVMTITDDVETLDPIAFNTAIPVKRNYLTTIYGPVLTDFNKVTVTIDDDFAQPENIVRKVNTTAELAAAVAEAADGDIILIGGEVTMPYFTDKEITFVGLNENAIVKQSPATHIDAHYSGAALNFENLTLVGEAYKNNTQGYQKAVKETYKNCHFVNYIMFAGNVTTVTDCTFENKGDYFWTGTADNITFTNCEFNGVERAVKVCTVGNAGARTVTFNNCQFTASTQVKSAIEIDGSKGSSYVVNINGCTATGFKVSDFTGESLFNVEGAENVEVYIDGNEWIEKGIVKDENGNYVVNSLTTLETALEAAAAAGAGNTTIVFAENAELNMTGVAWTPINVDGYNGADIVTIEGNGAVITGLTTPLFAGGFAGGSGIVIKDLTIKYSAIVSANTIGSGAFIESVDSMAKIELTNCHLLNSTVTGGAGSRTGGLIGWTAGYSNVNDGPVKTYVTIDGCSVVGCTIQCDGSVGGINGHAGNNDWTYTTIKNCIVKDNILASTDDGAWRVGVVVGTANVGEVTISNITESGNTLTQTGKTAPEGFKRNYYGRFVPGTTGKLTIDGEEVVIINSAENLEKVIENAQAGDTITIAGDITLTENVTIPAGVTFNGNGKQINGTLIAGGDITFAGHTKVTAFSAGFNGNEITIGEGACLEITGGGRSTMGYNNTFNITGTITDAKSADKANIQPSLIMPAGISITGGNGLELNIKDAYVQIGSTTSKPGVANGEFTLNFTNAIAEFTKEVGFYEPTGGVTPKFVMNIKDSVFTTGTKLCVAAANSTITVDNSIVTLGSYLRNSGTINLTNGSVLTGKTIQFGENGGNNGSINVDNSSLTIIGESTGNAFDGKGTGSITATNGTTVNVDYYKDMTISVDATSTFTGTEVL